MNRNKYNFGESKRAKGKVMADTPAKQSRVVDGKGRTYYESASSSDCWVGLDLGAKYKRVLYRIRYYINKGIIQPNLFVGALF